MSIVAYTIRQGETFVADVSARDRAGRLSVVNAVTDIQVISLARFQVYDLGEITTTIGSNRMVVTATLTAEQTAKIDPGDVYLQITMDTARGTIFDEISIHLFPNLVPTLRRAYSIIVGQFEDGMVPTQDTVEAAASQFRRLNSQPIGEPVRFSIETKEDALIGIFVPEPLEIASLINEGLGIDVVRAWTKQPEPLTIDERPHTLYTIGPLHGDLSVYYGLRTHQKTSS